MKLLSGLLISAIRRDERQRLGQTNRKLVHSEDSTGSSEDGGTQYEAATADQIQALSDNISKLNEQLKLREADSDSNETNDVETSHADEVSWYDKKK